MSEYTAPIGLNSELERAEGRDATVWWLAVVGSMASLASYYYFNRMGDVLLYKDAISHMEIARRVIDSPTTGFGQLGGVWLPLPHLLMLPLIWIDSMYYSGLAGSLVSMASYVVTGVLIYKIVHDLTHRKLAALVGALIFMSNPGVLYMQSTPMTELLLFACIAGMVYGVQRWVQTDNWVYLAGAASAALLGTLTRYESWVLLAALAVVIVFVAWRKGYSWSRIEGTVLAFLFMSGTGIVGWLGWNQLIFGNALYFQNGRYAKPSLWVGAGDIAVGHWSIALRTYWYAMVDDLRLPVVAVMAAGLVAMLIRERLSLRTLPALSTFSLFAFFVFALESGQRPLHVTQLTGDLYNVRFGLLMILPAAICGGYLAGCSSRWRALQFVGLAGVTVICLSVTASGFRHTEQIATLQEPLRWQQNATDTEATAAAFLKRHYSKGRILAQFFGSESLLFDARISPGNNVYEGSYRQWEPDLNAPAENGIRWIIMRNRDKSDEVYLELKNSPELQFYSKVFYNRQFTIYEMR